MTQVMACPDCDRLVRKSALRRGQVARCPYCDAVLSRGRSWSPEPVIALSLASLILFAVANLFPFAAIRSAGVEQEIRLSSGLFALADADVPLPGIAAIVFILVVPVFRFSGYLYVLLPMKKGIEPPAWRPLLRAVNAMLPWSMLEIYLLAVVVSMVKISELGTIVIGASFWALVLLVFTSTWLSAAVDRTALWELLDSWRQR
jgi:paraquat-inducible protein A